MTNHEDVQTAETAPFNADQDPGFREAWRAKEETVTKWWRARWLKRKQKQELQTRLEEAA